MDFLLKILKADLHFSVKGDMFRKNVIFLKKTLAFFLRISDNNKAMRWTSGVAVNMSPCHGEDRGFDSRLVRHFAGVVQW